MKSIRGPWFVKASLNMKLEALSIGYLLSNHFTLLSSLCEGIIERVCVGVHMDPV